jgi:peptide/nickel transport system permease protein
MSALLVLAAFAAIGLLDSLHYRAPLEGVADEAPQVYSNEVLSVLDWIMAPIREREEKTYSAPFATRLYAREAVETEDGRTVRIYPPLRYGGAHLEIPESERVLDLVQTSGRAIAEALLVTVIVVVLIVTLRARRHGVGLAQSWRALRAGRTELPWRSMLLSFAVLVMLIMLAAHLGVKYHILGTDKVGQDVFYQAVKSVRTGLVIGTLTTLVMLPFALVLGTMAGYFRGWVDDVIQYLYTTLNSIPAVLLIAAAVLMLHIYMANHADEFTSLAERADLRLLFLCLILGVTSWTGLCRYLRGETLKLREMDYIQAATALGVGHVRILLRHVLPNVMHIVLITVVLDFSALVLAEAVLSYVNIGVDPTMNSWGNMINRARLEMAREPVVWWSLAAALVFMFTLVLCANLFADAVRDAFDPRLRK